jgi:hypothetical protein
MMTYPSSSLRAKRSNLQPSMSRGVEHWRLPRRLRLLAMTVG